MLAQKRDVFFTNSSNPKYISLFIFFLLPILIAHSNECILKHFLRIVVSVLRAYAVALKWVMHDKLASSDPATAVANMAHRHDRSTD
jgi:threonine/homoserine/homoserine lactone efflux protein